MTYPTEGRNQAQPGELERLEAEGRAFARQHLGFTGDPIHFANIDFDLAGLTRALRTGSRVQPQTVRLILDHGWTKNDGRLSSGIEELDFAPESVGQLYIDILNYPPYGPAAEKLAHPEWEAIGWVRPAEGETDAAPKRVRLVLMNGWGCHPHYQTHPRDFDTVYMQYLS